MPHATVNGIELCYETHGDADDEPLLLVMGLGAQLVAWELELVHEIVARGYHVVRYDNRDVGLSTKFEDHDPTAALAGAFGGDHTGAPYLIADMASDAAGLLDHLGLDQAHVVGASMGGMIAQQLVIDHPHKVATLTSVMSTTGDPDVGAPTAEAMGALMAAMATPVTDKASAVEQALATWAVIGSPGATDEAAVRRRAEDSWDRDPGGLGVLRQLAAIMASPSRTEALGGVQVPALVVHGTVDPLVQPSGGQRTAEAIPGAELLWVEGMAHDLPRFAWADFFDALERHTARAPVRAVQGTGA